MPKDRLSDAQHELLGRIWANAQPRTGHEPLHRDHLLRQENPRTVAVLERRGLVEDVTPEDGSPTMVRLTAQGMEEFNRLGVAYSNAVRKAAEDDPLGLPKAAAAALHSDASRSWFPLNWWHVPYLVRLALVSRNMLQRWRDEWQVTEHGAAAREHDLYRTMGTGYQPGLVRADVDADAWAALVRCIEQEHGVASMLVPLACKQNLRELGLLRATDTPGTDVVTAPGYLVTGRISDLGHLAEVAASDYAAVLERRRRDVEDNDDRALHRAQDDRYREVCTPPGIDADAFFKVVRGLAWLDQRRRKAMDDHRQALWAMAKEQTELTTTANSMTTTTKGE